MKKNGRSKNAIDWQTVRLRLSQAGEKLARADELPPDALQEIWSLRAAQMAQAVELTDQGEQIELAIIRLGKEVYGLDVHYVHDIRPLDQITRVPRVPAWVAGVVNLRGRVISVLDLQKYLGLSGSVSGDPTTATRHLIVVETETMELAILADEVLSIETFPTSKIQEASSAVRSIRPEYVRGILVRSSSQNEAPAERLEPAGSDHNGSSSSVSLPLLVILDLPALLSDKQLVVHEEIL